MINDQRKNDKSYVVVAYVMLLFFILFGMMIGWLGHLALTSYKNSSRMETCLHGENH